MNFKSSYLKQTILFICYQVSQQWVAQKIIWFLPMAGVLELDDFKCPFEHKPLYDSMVHVSCSVRCHLWFPIKNWDAHYKNEDFFFFSNTWEIYRSEFYNNSHEDCLP